MFDEDVREAKWTLEAEVNLAGLLVARLGYAQMPNGWLVEAGGWGGRNNLEVVKHSLMNLTGVLSDAALHTYENVDGGVSAHWSCHTRKLYGGASLEPPHRKSEDT